MIGTFSTLSRRATAPIVVSLKFTCSSMVRPSTQHVVGRHSLFSSVPNLQNHQPSTPSKRKTRRRTDTSLKDVPSLSDFMHRSKVLKQYRSFIRLAVFLDGQNDGSGECRAALEEVRVAYKMGFKKGIDVLSKSMAYSEGERRLKELQSMVDFVSTKQQPGAVEHQNYDDDSWINIKDADDTRGRVGIQWPWEQDDDKKE